MRRLTALLLMFSIALLPTMVAAQSTPVPPATEATTSPTDLNVRELGLVRQAVTRTGDAYRRSRTSDGVGGIIGGLIVGAVGGYLWSAGKANNDPGLQVVGVGIGLTGVPQLVSGIWNIFYHTPQEDMAEKMLANDALLEGGGLLFVEQEARRARRSRFVGGTTQIVQGGATLATYYLYTQVFPTATNDVLLIFFGIASAFQVIGGVVSLVGKSGPERAYDNLVEQLGENPTNAPAKPGGRISNMRIFPNVTSNDGKLAGGLGLGFQF